MRFLQLNFSTFGPFTDFQLDFEPGSGLQVIYGPNESGKSSALRAVRGLLYGIPGDGRDEFLHPGDSLRLQAVIEHSDGHRLTFGRRKGRGKKTLLDEHGKSLRSDLLEGYLGGVDEQLFGRLYGLDHSTLVLGGKALLEEGGRVGESLFAAGLGTGVRQVRDLLKSEADSLYKPKGRTLLVDKTIEQFREAQRRAAELSVSAESWRKLAGEVAQEEERAAQLDRTIRDLETEKQRLVRYLDAHKPILGREDLLQELATLGDLPQLAVDFSERRQRAQTMLANESAALAKAHERAQGLTERIAALPNDVRLLAFAPRIDRLHRALDAVVDAQANLPLLEAKLAAIRSHLRDKAADLGLADDPEVFSRLPDALIRKQARILAERHRRMVEEQESLRTQKAALEAQRSMLASRRSALGEARDTEQLESSLRQLRAALGLDTEIAGAERARSGKKTALQSALRTLPLWVGSSDDLAGLMVPSEQTVQAFERRYHELTVALQQADRDLTDAELKGKKNAADLARLSEDGQVHSREDLRQTRARREQAWQTLLSQWREGHSASQGQEAQQRLEETVRESDDLADSLLDKAGQVVEVERLNREVARSRKEWRDLSNHKKERQVEQQQLRDEWWALWSSPHLKPEDPTKMRDWLARRESVLVLAAEVEELTETLETAQARREELLLGQAQVWEGLVSSERLGATVGEAIERSERVLAPLKATAEERRQLSADLTKLELSTAEIAAVMVAREQALATWKSEWSGVTAAFQREASTDPLALESLLDRYEELKAMLDDSVRVERQFDEQVAQVASFTEQVKELACEIQQTLDEGADLSMFVTRQVAELAEQRRVLAVRQQLGEELRALESEVSESTRAREQSQAQWLALLSEAGLSGPEGLGQLEANVFRFREVTERLRDLEVLLRPLAGGQSLDDFAQGLAGLDWDTLPGQIRDLERRLADQEQARNHAWQRKGQLEQELRGCDGSEAAASAAQEAAEAMAEGKAAVARYVRLCLSEAVLKREMERYRKENEGPVLKAASGWFGELTCGAYAGLTTGSDPKTDEPRLEAVTFAGRHVAVDGLSDGTRDQLFLALRLATIAQTLESSEPIPLVLDDVLVHFDGARAEATLRVLAHFAQRTQILLFTHLDRDRELALALPNGQAAVHGLQPIGL